MPNAADSLRVPSYRRHKPTGQAVVTLSGRDIYLGKWNTKASRAEYDRLIGEWLASGRCLPTPGGVTIAELALAYWRHAKAYYRKDGKPTGSADRIRVAVRTLRQSYGQTLARDFGPLALQAVQRRLAESGKSRRYVNYLVDTVRRISGDKPFFLACRSAGNLLGVDHTTAWRWLFLLAHDGIVEEVEKGDRARRRASRYRYRAG